MPPKRRASGPATKSQQQSTLAFHGASNKVTKAGPRQSAKKLLDDVAAPTKEVKPEPEVIELIDEPTTAEAAIIRRGRSEADIRCGNQEVLVWEREAAHGTKSTSRGLELAREDP
jgi:hypothetical protein